MNNGAEPFPPPPFDRPPLVDPDAAWEDFADTEYAETVAADPLAQLGARPLSTIPTDGAPPLLIDRLDPAGHTILFGPGGVGKGTVASSWIAELVLDGLRVLIVDYENHPDEWARRVDGLGDADSRSAILWVGPYTAAWQGIRGPIWRQAADLRRLAEAWAADVVVIDSIVPACGATDPTKPEASAQYAAALELIGRPVLSLAHVPKADVAPVYPFGSAFWHNLARVTWSLTAGAAGQVILTNRKANNYARIGRSVLAITWMDGVPRDILERPYTAVLSERIDTVLGVDPLTVREIVARLEDERDEDEPKVKPDSVRAALRRGLRATPARYVVAGTGDGAKWSRVP